MFHRNGIGIWDSRNSCNDGRKFVCVGRWGGEFVMSLQSNTGLGWISCMGVPMEGLLISCRYSVLLSWKTVYSESMPF